MLSAPRASNRTQHLAIEIDHRAAGHYQFELLADLAYVDQITQDHPELNAMTAAADCQLAVSTFCDMAPTAATRGQTP